MLVCILREGLDMETCKHVSVSLRQWLVFDETLEERANRLLRKLRENYFKVENVFGDVVIEITDKRIKNSSFACIDITKRKIILSKDAYVLNDEELETTLAHELAHLICLRHGKRFREVLFSYCPYLEDNYDNLLDSAFSKIRKVRRERSMEALKTYALKRRMRR
jgi:predicted metal-dependent hydrolase